jgi:UDP-N-acetylmuramyl pentapeptide phosphotransferase/UDP-N-acetylglucosamine-1-phosphate transferase
VAGGRYGGARQAREIAAILLPSVVSSGLLLVVYYTAPLDRPLDRATGWLFVLAMLLFAALMAVGVRDILRSVRPRLQAIRVLGMGLPLLLVVFAASYCTIAGQEPGAFSEPLSRTDGIYFTVTVFATVGFGDITPVSELARVLVTVQMLVGLVAVGLVAKVLLGAVQVAVTRRAGVPGPAEDDRARLP